MLPRALGSIEPFRRAFVMMRVSDEPCTTHFFWEWSWRGNAFGVIKIYKAGESGVRAMASIEGDRKLGGCRGCQGGWRQFRLGGSAFHSFVLFCSFCSSSLFLHFFLLFFSSYLLCFVRMLILLDLFPILPCVARTLLGRVSFFALFFIFIFHFTFLMDIWIWP